MGIFQGGGNTPFPQIWEKPNGDLAQIFTHYFPLGFNSLGYVPSVPTLGSEKGWVQLMAMILGLSLIAKKESSQKKKQKQKKKKKLSCPPQPSLPPPQLSLSWELKVNSDLLMGTKPHTGPLNVLLLCRVKCFYTSLSQSFVPKSDPLS